MFRSSSIIGEIKFRNDNETKNLRMHHIDQMITIMDVILRDSNKNALIHLINAKHTLYMIDDIFVEHRSISPSKRPFTKMIDKIIINTPHCRFEKRNEINSYHIYIIRRFLIGHSSIFRDLLLLYFQSW